MLRGTYKEEPVREPGEGELLIKILYISLDPAMRGWMNEGKSYIAPSHVNRCISDLAGCECHPVEPPGLRDCDHPAFSVSGLPTIRELSPTARRLVGFDVRRGKGTKAADRYTRAGAN